MGRKFLDYLSMYTVDANGCWLYTGRLNRKGYGAAGSHGSAHRYFYTRLVGPIPEGLQIDHLCMVPRCVNPAHMEPVTVQENLRRKYEAMVLPETCSRGHVYTEENTYMHPTGYRDCKDCRKINKKNFRERRKAAA